jgi:hypothetical protein
MMNMRAQPMAIGDDHVSYLHTDFAPPAASQRHIVIEDARVSLRRWLDGDHKAQLCINTGAAMLAMSVDAEQLRAMAWAMLQCAGDITASAEVAP